MVLLSRASVLVAVRPKSPKTATACTAVVIVITVELVTTPRTLALRFWSGEINTPVLPEVLKTAALAVSVYTPAPVRAHVKVVPAA